MEEAELRSWIEKFQVRLQACGQVSSQQLQTVLESLVMKKQSLCEMLQYWNSRSASAGWLRKFNLVRVAFGVCCASPLSALRLQELFQLEKGRKRLSVPPSPGRHRQTTDDGKVSNIIIVGVITPIQLTHFCLPNYLPRWRFLFCCSRNVWQEGKGGRAGREFSILTAWWTKPSSRPFLEGGQIYLQMPTVQLWSFLRDPSYVASLNQTIRLRFSNLPVWVNHFASLSSCEAIPLCS